MKFRAGHVSRMSESDQSNISTPPSSSIPQPIEQDSYDKFRGTGTPVVIDNGSTTFRYGFCTASEPHQGSNVVARFKERKSTKPLLLFGEGIDMDSSARAQARTPWEGDVLLNFDALVSDIHAAYTNTCQADWSLGDIGACHGSCIYPFGS